MVGGGREDEEEENVRRVYRMLRVFSGREPSDRLSVSMGGMF